MSEPNEVLVHDEPTACSYLPDRVARLPLRHPVGGLSPAQFDQRLASGDRRTGPFLYRTACPSCQACKPIRVPVREFCASRSQRRVLSRGDRVIATSVNRPGLDAQRVALFNKHGSERGLSAPSGPISMDNYREFLLSSCCETVEVTYTVDDRLVAVAILDVGEKACSAVYCYFDTDYSRLSLGVYSVLQQIRLARQWDMDYLYLGLYIAESPHMNYKTRYRPCQLLLDGQWRDADRSR